MYCSKCGEKFNINNKYCSHCGNRLENKIENSSLSDKDKSLIAGVVCVCSSFIFNILCFIPGIMSIFYANNYKKESGKYGIGFWLAISGMLISVLLLVLIILIFYFIFNVGNYIDVKDYNVIKNYFYLIS